MNATDAVNVITFLERQIASDLGSYESEASLRRVADHLKAQVQRLIKPVGDGGSAFPVLQQWDVYSNVITYAQTGASLRDWFAKEAMHAEIVTCGVPGEAADAMLEAMNPEETFEEHIARTAYLMADAMLKVRQE